jgi:glutamate dehydrogenase/leucine dehydrogenase
MQSIFHSVNDASKTYCIAFIQGAHIAGFKKVADTILWFCLIDNKQFLKIQLEYVQ